MNKLPVIKNIKKLDKKKFVKLAEKVKLSLKLEKEFLEKNEKDNNSSEFIFSN